MEGLSFFHGLFSNVWSVALVFVFLGVSICVHELGHFLVARARGLKIDRFSIGFGPKIFGWRGRDGVDYRISLLPLGGYVSLPQMADLEAVEGRASAARETLPPLSFTDKVCVLAAGAGFNLLFALLVACVLWATGMPSAAEAETTRIGYVAPLLRAAGASAETPSPAAAAGLRAGDRILKIDGARVSRFADIVNYVMTGSDRAPDGRPRATLTVERDGRVFDVEVFPALVEVNAVSGDAVRKLGVLPAQAMRVGRVMENSPAALAGIRAGDVVVRVDGEPAFHAYALTDKTRAGLPVSLELERDGVRRTVEIAPRALALTRPVAQVFLKGQKDCAFSLFDSENGGLCVFSADDVSVFGDMNPAGAVALKSVNGAPCLSAARFCEDIAAAKGPVNLVFENDGALRTVVLPAGVTARLAPMRAHAAGIEFESGHTLVRRNPLSQIADVAVLTWRTLSSLVSPSSDVAVSMLSGPVGILRVYHQLLNADFRLVLWFTVLLNVNLAILNLLPLPVLDGGHIAFALFEKLRGKPVPLKALAVVNGVFMLLLLGMILYITFFDSRRWQGDRRAESIAAERARWLVVPSFDPVDRP